MIFLSRLKNRYNKALSQADKVVSYSCLLTNCFVNRKKSKKILFFPWGDRKRWGSVNLRVFEIARVLQKKGYECAVVPFELSLLQRRKIISVFRPDVIVIQKCGHPLNRAYLYSDFEIPIIFDIDDADYVRPQYTDVVRELCEQSAAVVAGSRAVANWCRQYNENVHVVWTGTPSAEPGFSPQAERRPVLAWAVSNPIEMPEEADFVLTIFKEVKRLYPAVILRVYGVPTGNEGSKFVERLRSICTYSEIFTFMPYADYLKSLQEVAVGLHPLVNIGGFAGGKSFGKVLAYIISGVPVVTTPTVDHPLFFSQNKTGVMVKSEGEWIEAILKLLQQPDARQEMALSAREAFNARLTTEKAADLMASILKDVVRTARS